MKDPRTAGLEPRWVDVAAVPVHALVSSTAPAAERPSIVLVSGMVVSSRFFAPIARELAPHRRVYAPDLPGFGRSGRPRRALNVRQLADALGGWMDAIGLEGAVVVGTSFGSQVVVDLAVRRPELFDRLVLVGPTMDPQARSAPKAFGRWLFQAPNETGTGPMLARDYLRAGLPRAMRTIQHALRDAVEKKLPRVTIRTLVVRGERDPIAPQAWVEQVTRLLPDAELVVVPGHAHAVHVSAPDLMAQLLLAFIGTPPGARLRTPTALAHAWRDLARVKPRRNAAQPLTPPPYLAAFDSSSAMLRATARYLCGEDFPKLGIAQPLAPLVPLVNLLPSAAREAIYIWGGWSEAAPVERVARVRTEDLARWVVSEYAPRRYPVAMIGSSNGANVHLCAALDAPWLPQTFLLPVRRSGVPPDRPRLDMEWARQPARVLLDANPDLQLHHMHDPNQDRLMVRKMTYFRVKLRRVPNAYRRFLEDRLEPGATIFIVECRKRWPVVRVSDRHVFQPGAVGGAAPEEYVRGGPRVEDYLRRYDSPLAGGRGWDSPEPDEDAPEAEWGFEPSIAAEVEELAERCGYRVRRIVFEEPTDLSPLVADLYRSWYARRGIEPARLLVESFILMEPYWALRTASVPYWSEFAVEPSVERLEAYLDGTDPYDEIRVMLFSHGTEGIGLARPDRWRGVLRRARRLGDFLGVDEDAFPRDFGALARYHPAVKSLPQRHPLPDPLTLDDLDAFVASSPGGYAVSWK